MENDKTDIIYILNNYDTKGKTLRDIYQTLLKEIETDQEIDSDQPIEEQLKEIEDLKRRNK